MKFLIALGFFIFLSSPVLARNSISIVGSSTVYPFAAAASESFIREQKFKSPVVESTGTGGGFKLFCSGVGPSTPDIVNASREIKESEIDNCTRNGVTPIELKIGYDGIVLANSKSSKRLNVTRNDLFLALAKQIPVNGVLVDNPNKTWKQVRSDLPDIKIEILGPPPTSGTRDAFLELVMDHGAEKFKIDKKIGRAIREDGAFIEAGENDNLIIKKLINNPDAFGIFGFSYLDQNLDKVQGSLIEDVSPEIETISSGRYLISRPLFSYVKREHLSSIVGLRDFVRFYVSDKIIGEDGVASNKGLIPLSVDERNTLKLKVKGL